MSVASERLQKVLARAGVASRRGAEDLIRQGRVRVNGRPVTEMGVQVDPARDRVVVDGRPLAAERLTYILLHKPVGVISSARDPKGRRTVLDLVPDAGVRLYPVGRLDYDTSGLILLTNDGELAHALTHPSRGVPKTYRALVQGRPDGSALELLTRGVALEDGLTAPARVRLLSGNRTSAWLDITIHEGRNHQVRRMLEAVGHPVKSLTRVVMGALRLGDLPPGEHRPLKPVEIASLYDAAGLEAPPSSADIRSEGPARAQRPARGTGGKPPSVARPALAPKRPRPESARERPGTLRNGRGAAPVPRGRTGDERGGSRPAPGGKPGQGGSRHSHRGQRQTGSRHHRGSH